MLICHFRFVSRARKTELYTLPLLASLGFLIDCLFIQVGLIELKNHDFPPIWLFEIWLVFVTTLDYSMKPLFQRPFVLLILTTIAAPLSYSVGEYWELLNYGQPLWLSMGLHGLVWGLLMLSFAPINKTMTRHLAA